MRGLPLALVSTLATAASAQTLSASASALTALQVSGNPSGSATAPPGTPLPAGFTLGGALANVATMLTVDASGTTVHYALSENSVTGLGINASTGPHSTLLAVTASAPTSAQVRVRWTHPGPDVGVTPRYSISTWVDIGNDGVHDWTGVGYLPSPALAQFNVQLGAQPLQIATSTSTWSNYVGYTNSREGTGPSLLEIDVALPPTVMLHLVGGDGQLSAAGEVFPQPVAVRASLASGQPVAGVPVTFTSSAGTVASGPVLTDAAGIAQTNVIGPPGGGPFTVTAFSGSLPLATANLDASLLFLLRYPTYVTVDIQYPYAPQPTPFVLMCSAPGIAPLATPIGPICTNPLSPLSFVLEDSIGFFQFRSLTGAGAIGGASLLHMNLPASHALSGVTLSFQGVGLHPLQGLFRTNCATRTL